MTRPGRPSGSPLPVVGLAESPLLRLRSRGSLEGYVNTPFGELEGAALEEFFDGEELEARVGARAHRGLVGGGCLARPRACSTIRASTGP